MEFGRIYGAHRRSPAAQRRRGADRNRLACAGRFLSVVYSFVVLHEPLAGVPFPCISFDHVGVWMTRILHFKGSFSTSLCTSWILGRRGFLLHLSKAHAYAPCQYHRRVVAAKFTTSRTHLVHLNYIMLRPTCKAHDKTACACENGKYIHPYLRFLRTNIRKTAPKGGLSFEDERYISAWG